MTSRVPFLDLGGTHREIDQDLRDAYERVTMRSSFVLGEEGAAFEREFSAYCGARECVTTGNGQDALEILLRAYDIGPGDEVIVPAFTFAATWFCVSRVGATAVPVDVSAASYTLDPSAFEAAITAKTRAVIPVHLYGHPAAMAPICDMAREHGIMVIEDAAQAHGATYRGRHAGALGDAAAFSFYPTKNLGALGDAGAIVTGDSAVARAARMLRNYGSERKYEHERVGQNSRMDELQAAFLRTKIPHLERWNEARRRVAAAYGERLAPFGDLVTLPSVADDTQHAWHLFVVRVKHRDAVAERMDRSGVATLVHYPKTIREQHAYAGIDIPHDISVSTALARDVLSLPMWPQLEDRDIEIVCDALVEAAQKVA